MFGHPGVTPGIEFISSREWQSPHSRYLRKRSLPEAGFPYSEGRVFVEAIAMVRKALVALAISGGSALLAAIDPKSAGGDVILAGEWWFIAGTALAAAGAVFLVPNALTSSQRAQVIAEYQAARFRGSSGRSGGREAT